MSIINVKDRKDMKAHLRTAGERLVVIGFSSVRCVPCQTILPYYDRLSEIYSPSGTIFLHVDIEQDPENTAKFDVTVIPTFIFIKKLNVLDRYVGIDQYALEEKILKCQAARVISDTAVRADNGHTCSGDRRSRFGNGTTSEGKPPPSRCSDNSLSSTGGSKTRRRSKSHLRRQREC